MYWRTWFEKPELPGLHWPVLESTSFSNFIRNATDEERKQVFYAVLKQASEDQRRLIDNPQQEGV